MTRTRSTPEQRPDIKQDRVVFWGAFIAYKPDGSPDTGNTVFRYTVNTVDANGDIVKSGTETVPFADWPAPFKAKVKNLHNNVVVDGENKGKIGAGTDTDDMP